MGREMRPGARTSTSPTWVAATCQCFPRVKRDSGDAVISPWLFQRKLRRISSWLTQLPELLWGGNEIRMWHSQFPKPVPRCYRVAFLNRTVAMDVREKQSKCQVIPLKGNIQNRPFYTNRNVIGGQGRGREGELLPCGFILLVFGDWWKSSRNICKYA